MSDVFYNRLDGDAGDSLMFMIQDDISGVTLTKFACVAQGHAVQE